MKKKTNVYDKALELYNDLLITYFNIIDRMLEEVKCISNAFLLI